MRLFEFFLSFFYRRRMVLYFVRVRKMFFGRPGESLEKGSIQTLGGFLFFSPVNNVHGYPRGSEIL